MPIIRACNRMQTEKKKISQVRGQNRPCVNQDQISAVRRPLYSTLATGLIFFSEQEW